MRLLSAAVLLAGCSQVHAQGRGGMGMPGGGMGGRPMGMPHGGGIGNPRDGMGIPGAGGSIPGNSVPGGFPRGGPPPAAGGSPNSSMRGGLQLGPPGRWWDDKKFAKSLGLNDDQKKHMDAIFGQNRDALVTRRDSLQVAESRLEALTRGNRLSEAALFSEIDHVAQARAELEKSMTHMLLQLRDEMTPEQIGKLDDHR